MLIRYTTDSSGKRKPIAKIYTAEEHNIDHKHIDDNAKRIIERLKNAGFEAYIVGGAVRDLLLQKHPKDFDIATSASPNQIKKLFWNSRIIGKRFKIVHIHFSNTIYEVTTFRSKNTQGQNKKNNVYGTLHEDAFRRDFSVNALYYCPIENQVLDFVEAMKDFKAKKIRSVIPLNITFVEDPVRMIRGVKYSVTTEFSLGFKLKRAIKSNSFELKRCSASRMTEEVLKILHSGYSKPIIERLIALGLFKYMLPVIDDILKSGKNKPLLDSFYTSLSALDERLDRNSSNAKGNMISAAAESFLLIPDEYESTYELFRDVFKQIKKLIYPITPPNIDVEKAVADIFKQEQIRVPKHALKRGKKKVQKTHTKKEENANIHRNTRSKRGRKKNQNSAKNSGQNPT
ncbi:MAG: polynucleotide adenylyltransferase PcnB [Spirochaetia bacterium]|nr:polynucleotide adenylyltransferase PcnB [Spirochaetia bacterium]MCF7946761.1 polynucleotide adenylyltransferase PcnB [Spirochaetia bacterium]